MKSAASCAGPVRVPGQAGAASASLKGRVDAGAGFTVNGLRYEVALPAGHGTRFRPLHVSHFDTPAPVIPPPDPMQSLHALLSPDASVAEEGDDWAVCDAAPLAPLGTLEETLDETAFSRAFHQGLEPAHDTALGGRWRALCVAAGPIETKLRFLATQSNPYWLSGMLRNLGAYGPNLLGRPLALPPLVVNRNCVYCAKAVDRSLDGAQADAMDTAPLWLARETRQGSLAFLTCAPGVRQGVVRVRPATPLVDALFQTIAPGRRAIASLPVLGYAGVRHAVNVVHLADGGRYLIDAQRNQVYDVARHDDRKRLEGVFGSTGAEVDPHMTVPALYFDTGPAPRWTRAIQVA